MTTLARLGQLRGTVTASHRRSFARTVARTASFNMAAMVAAGLSGVIIARAVGPTVRGEYAAVTSWFGVALMVGEMASLCTLLLRRPGSAARPRIRGDLALMMLTTGGLTIVAGMFVRAPLLGHGDAGLTAGYRIAFGASIVAFVGASYTFSLQARDLRRWNVLRLSQPVLSLIAIVTLWRLRVLTLDVTLLVLVVTMLLQLGWAYRCCRHVGLAPGHARVRLIRPLSAYGAAQIAALTPAVLNADLDQLVLSQTVPAADLGRYAIAVSLCLLPLPLVSAIGNVAFPSLAAQHEVTGATRRLQRFAVLASAGLSVGTLVPLAAVAYWMVPWVFGASYRGAVPLLWVLTPGSVFLACGQVVGDLLRGRSHPGAVAWSQGLAAIFTVVLLFALLPVVGVYGAAIASTVSYGVALAAMLRRLGRLPREATPRASQTAKQFVPGH